jgi:hypothetical protein
MLISVYPLEATSITFEDIKRNRKALLDKRDNRKFELQGWAEIIPRVY